MTEEKEKKFYYRGVYSSNEQDFLTSVMDFHSSPSCEESIDDLTTELYQNIKMFALMNMPRMSNRILMKKLENIFIFAMKELCKIEEEGEEECRSG